MTGSGSRIKNNIRHNILNGEMQRDEPFRKLSRQYRINCLTEYVVTNLVLTEPQILSTFMTKIDIITTMKSWYDNEYKLSREQNHTKLKISVTFETLFIFYLLYDYSNVEVDILYFGWFDIIHTFSIYSTMNNQVYIFCVYFHNFKLIWEP